MPQLNGPNPLFIIDGVTINAEFIEVSLKRQNEVKDASRGTGSDKQVQAGQNSTTINFTLAYNIGTVQNIITHIQPGARVQIEYGPEQAVAGKPRHVQYFLIDSLDGPKQNTKKDVVNFVGSGQSDGTASVDFYTGGVY